MLGIPQDGNCHVMANLSHDDASVARWQSEQIEGVGKAQTQTRKPQPRSHLRIPGIFRQEPRSTPGAGALRADGAWALCGLKAFGGGL